MSLIIHRHSFHHIRSLLLTEFLGSGHRNTPENVALIDDVIVAEIFDETMTRMCWTKIPPTRMDVRQKAVDIIGFNQRRFDLLMAQGISTQIQDKVAGSIPKTTWDIWTVEYDQGNVRLSNYGDYRVAMWEADNPDWQTESVHPEEIVIPMLLRKPKVAIDEASSEEVWQYPAGRLDSALGPDDMPGLVRTCMRAVKEAASTKIRKKEQAALVDEEIRLTQEEDERESLNELRNQVIAAGLDTVQARNIVKRSSRVTKPKPDPSILD